MHSLNVICILGGIIILFFQMKGVKNAFKYQTYCEELRRCYLAQRVEGHVYNTCLLHGQALVMVSHSTQISQCVGDLLRYTFCLVILEDKM